MTVIFGIADDPNFYTTDPEVVPGSRQIQEGDYVRLPNDKVYKLESDYPTVFVLVPEVEIPFAVQVLEAKAYDPVIGKLLTDVDTPPL